MKAKIRRCHACGHNKRLANMLTGDLCMVCGHRPQKFCLLCGSEITFQHGNSVTCNFCATNRSRWAMNVKIRNESAAIRLDILNRDDWRCSYCYKHLTVDDAHVDHKTPVARGGTSNPSNLTAACDTCNIRKGIMTYDEFIAKVGVYDILERSSEVLELV